MRLFIAINFDKNIRDKMIAVQERLKAAERGNLAENNTKFRRDINGETLSKHDSSTVAGNNQKINFYDNSRLVSDSLRTHEKSNFTREENLHLTLAFIGETEPSKIDDIKDAMNSLTVPETELVFSSVGFFKSGADKSQLWWIGAKNNPKLSEFQKKLCFALNTRSIKPDMKPFKPHITLARRMNLSKWDKTALLPEPFAAEVSHISLMLSERIDGKLTYTEIYRR